MCPCTAKMLFLSLGLSKKLVKIAQNKECEKLKKWLPSIKKPHLLDSRYVIRARESGKVELPPEPRPRHPLPSWPWVPPVFAPATHFKGQEQMVDSRYVHPICIVNVRLVFIYIHINKPNNQCHNHFESIVMFSPFYFTGTPAFSRLEKVLTNKRVLNDVGKLSPHYQTSSFESFHGVILRFAPKNVVFLFVECYAANSMIIFSKKCIPIMFYTNYYTRMLL